MMTHLAQRFGVDGYESIRELYAEAIRNQVVGFAEKAGLQLTRHELKDERALAAKMANSLTNQIATLAPPDIIEQLVAARLASARRVRLTLPICHAVAWHIDCILSLLGDRRDLLKRIAAIGRARLRFAFSKDVLLAVDSKCNAHHSMPTIALSSTRLTRTRVR
jgi:DNA-binding MurR/RpiR family transcriptional regulator